MKRSATGAIVCATASLWLPLCAAAQTVEDGDGNGTDGGAPALEAFRMNGALEIRLDGRIDEELWRSATPITDFTQQEPVEGGVPSEETEIRVVFDEDHLYIGVIVYDDPAGVLAHQRQRDAGLGTDDRFMWILDTFLDGRTGYFFEINAAGLMGDGLIGSGRGGGGFGGGPGGGPGGGGGGANKAWDGIWEARTSMRSDGWSAEIRIPFRTLNFDPDLDTWGINFQRTIRRRNEEILWRGYRRNEGLRSPVYAGRLTGLRNISQGLGLEARPSTVASWRNEPGTADATTYPADVSLDLNYSVTSSLRASVSINTDFAEVESDQRRVNLTRFPQRFPERRDFFLEGSGVFSFASSSGPSPFFSRQIGLNEGQQIPIRYGTRVTGQVGAFEVGFYQIGTGADSFFDDDEAVQVDIPRESFTVARLKRRIFEQSAIGAIYARRATSADPTGFSPEDAHTAGVDLDFSTRHFLGDNNAEMEAFVAWNSNPDPTQDLSFGDLTSRGGRISFPNDIWSGHVSYREFGEAYDPAMGFVTRNGFRRLEPRIGWSPRPSIAWIRNLDFSAQFRNLTAIETGVVEEREWQLKPLGINFESGDNIDVNFTRLYEFLDEGFEVSDGVDILPGGYTNWEYRVNGRTTGRRPVSLFGGVTRGGFWNGDRTQMDARVTFRPSPGVSISTNFEHNDVSLPQGDFTADVYEVEGQWNPSPWVSATTQVQYDNDSEIVGLFARLRWIVQPGNDVFLVYTHNWQNFGAGILENRDLTTLSRGASVKLNYTYRF
jgi:hypothetical protein